MFLDILIFFNKRKLERLIKQSKDYKGILTRSQKLDRLIMKKTLRIMNKKKKSDT